jgi:SNF2 family DNA or RNA helicase
MLTMLDNGDVVDVPNAVSCLVRLQQVISGYLPTEDNTFEVFSNDRIEQMLEIINQREGQAVIWARFTQDILRIMEVLNKEYGNGSAVAYYGGNVNSRDDSIKLFLANNARFFVSNQAAGSTGLNLHTSGCQTVIYFSNSFNYIERVQSEDRTHRLGTKTTVTYFDLVADKSIDKHILTNLRNKKSVSDLTLDEIRKSLF